VRHASSDGSALASRRARREHASQDPVWDVWMLAAVVAGALLIVGGFLSSGIMGALGGLVAGSVLAGIGVVRNDAARARMLESLQTRVARSRRRARQEHDRDAATEPPV
jgi:hypothetical protein